MPKADLNIKGMKYDDRKLLMELADIRVQLTIDELGKTLSVGDDNIRFSVPYEPIERVIKKMKTGRQK